MSEENNSFQGPDSAQSCGFEHVCERLRSEFGDELYDSWFSRLELTRVGDNKALLTAPTAFMKLWIDKHFLSRIRLCFSSEFPGVTQVCISVRETQACVTPSESFANPEQMTQKGPMIGDSPRESEYVDSQ